MAQQRTQQVATGPRPIVPYLRLPQKEGEEAYLVGCKCPHCGALYVGVGRVACGKCAYVGDLPEVRLSHEGELYTWTIVHRSLPNIPVPYIAAIVDLKDGVSVRATIVGLEPDPSKIKFGMKLRMVTDKAFTDPEGRDVIRYAFRPA